MENAIKLHIGNPVYETERNPHRIPNDFKTFA
jgi:hypothetical protein